MIVLKEVTNSLRPCDFNRNEFQPFDVEFVQNPKNIHNFFDKNELVAEDPLNFITGTKKSVNQQFHDNNFFRFKKTPVQVRPLFQRYPRSFI